MSTPSSHRPLEADHSPQAVAERLAQATRHSYLGDFIFGAVDGVVTTFAIVSGSAGAEFSGTVALVLGFANLAADGFSMAVSNYLSTKAEQQVLQQVRRREERHIRDVPEGEREEIRQIFAAKGFEGDLLEQIVEVITSDRRRWVDTMVTEEHGLQLQTPSPTRAALATFAAFVIAGFIPLAPYCLPLEMSPNTVFAVSAIATAITFFAIGWAKGHVLERSRLLSGLETLLVGGAAATLAYVVGVLLAPIGRA
jgi:VIT1/CCC1 family predicted Fe2+/Mn2+ transporter